MLRNLRHISVEKHTSLIKQSEALGIPEIIEKKLKRSRSTVRQATSSEEVDEDLCSSLQIRL